MRGGLKITITDHEVDRGDARIPDWLSRFADEYKTEQKTAVEVARERNEPSVHDKIYAIMNGGKISPYATVDEAVKDYQKRTGLLDLKKKAAAALIIEASEGEEEKKTSKPKVIDENPAIDSYIHNVIETQYGIQLPAVIQSILEAFSRHGVSREDIDSEDMARYINDILKSRRPRNHVEDMNLGRGVGTERNFFELNDSNRDPFVGLVPRRSY